MAEIDVLNFLEFWNIIYDFTYIFNQTVTEIIVPLKGEKLV
jgi:hypothetical protein